jgi:hypothetical protein
VKFMLLIYNNQAALAALPAADRDAIFADVDVIMKELTASGELAGGGALGDVAKTVTVSSKGGALAETDGPFLEAKEHFAGYLVVDVATVERAVEIARRWPDARYGAMEVRQLMDTV